MHVLVGKRHRCARRKRLRNIKRASRDAPEADEIIVYATFRRRLDLVRSRAKLIAAACLRNRGRWRWQACAKPFSPAIAAIGIGVAGAASAQSVHVMTVPVPGGGVAQIRYIGEVPPQIVFVPAPAAFDPWMPVSSVFGHEFAIRDARPDRGRDGPARGGDVPLCRGNGRPRQCRRSRRGGDPGRCRRAGQSYSYVSTISGSGVCTQSVRITSRGDGAAAGRAAQLRKLRTSGRAAGGPVGGSAGGSGPCRAAEAARPDPDAEQRPEPVCRDGPAGGLYRAVNGQRSGGTVCRLLAGRLAGRRRSGIRKASRAPPRCRARRRAGGGRRHARRQSSARPALRRAAGSAPSRRSGREN